MERVTPLIEARNLVIGHHGKALIANIGLRLEPGSVLCLLGPNGAGKTTLFRTLLGLIPPVHGQIFLGGKPLSRMTRAQIATSLAHVPQSLTTPFAFTAFDIVLMGAATRLGHFSRPGKDEMRTARSALERLGIADLAEIGINRLSGGQRQLVLIARALAQEAGAIVMDEPTASLDFANRRQVGQAVRRLADAGTGIILSSHDPDHAAAIADHALLLNRKGILASGPVSETMTSDNLSRLYAVPVHKVQSDDGHLHFY